MTNEQAKQAFLDQCPIIDENPKNRDKTVYKCISAIGFTMIKGKPVMFCECQDYNTNSITVSIPQFLSRYEENEA